MHYNEPRWYQRPGIKLSATGHWVDLQQVDAEISTLERALIASDSHARDLTAERDRLRADLQIATEHIAKLQREIASSRSLAASLREELVLLNKGACDREKRLAEELLAERISHNKTRQHLREGG